MNELAAHPTKVIAVLLGAIGATTLLVSVIRNDKHIRGPWARQATVLAAVLMLIWCAASLWLVMRAPLIPRNIASVITLLATAIGCVAAGILIALLMSRSIVWRCPPERDKPNELTADRAS